jgi:dihydrofolate synthase / folylpolyglutamate synthase
MSYREATEHLDALGIDAMKKLPPSRQHIEALCELMNHPERTVPAIHITGTNGKTSVARLASSILTATGLSVGTYTSPHLQSVRERIAFAGEPLSEDTFGDVFDHIYPYVKEIETRLGEPLSYFEILTGMFFLWAAESVDAMVVEVGLGGIWDATNVLPASVPVVTNIGLDHTQMLGTDRESIATEKVGIVKPGSILVTAERSPDVLAVLAKGPHEVSLLGRDWDVLDNRVALGGRYLSVRASNETYDGLFVPLHGTHQGVNAATAVEAVARFLPANPPSHEVLVEGLGAARVPGRLETMRSETARVPVILDVAHNPDGMSAMIGSLVEAFAFERCIFVMGVLRDKDHEGMLSELARVVGVVIATEAREARSVPADELATTAEMFGMTTEISTDVPRAIARALELAEEGDLICVTGSHYVVGEARNVLLPSNEETTPTRKR